METLEAASSQMIQNMIEDMKREKEGINVMLTDIVRLNEGTFIQELTNLFKNEVAAKYYEVSQKLLAKTQKNNKDRVLSWG